MTINRHCMKCGHTTTHSSDGRCSSCTENDIKHALEELAKLPLEERIAALERQMIYMSKLTSMLQRY